MGIVALLMAWIPFLGLVPPLVALGLGIPAWVVANRRRTGKGMAVAGTVLGAIAFLGAAAMVVFLVAFMPTPPDVDLTPEDRAGGGGWLVVTAAEPGADWADFVEMGSACTIPVDGPIEPGDRVSCTSGRTRVEHVWSSHVYVRHTFP